LRRLRDRRRRRLDFDAGTLTISSTHVISDGTVIEEDGKSDGSRRTIALDPYTLGVLRSHVRMLDAERASPVSTTRTTTAVLLGGRPAAASGHDHRPIQPASGRPDSHASGCTTFATATRPPAGWLGSIPRS
jgi:hypothetical protein